MLARLLDLLDVTGLLFVQSPVVLTLQQVGKPEDGVQGGAKLVAHGREKTALVLVRLPKLKIGSLEPGEILAKLILVFFPSKLRLWLW